MFRQGRQALEPCWRVGPEREWGLLSEPEPSMALAREVFGLDHNR